MRLEQGMVFIENGRKKRVAAVSTERVTELTIITFVDLLTGVYESVFDKNLSTYEIWGKL